MAATDPLRLQLVPAAVFAAGRSIIAGLVDCLPPASPASPRPHRPGLSNLGLSERGLPDRGPAVVPAV